MKRKPSSEILADAIAVLHFVWAVFFWGGTVAVVFWHAYAPIQAWVLVVAFVFKIPFDNNCILTVIEERLRKAGNPGWKGNGSFLATYCNKVFGTNVSAKKAKTLFLVLFFVSCILTIFALMNP